MVDFNMFSINVNVPCSSNGVPRVKRDIEKCDGCWKVDAVDKPCPRHRENQVYLCLEAINSLKPWTGVDCETKFPPNWLAKTVWEGSTLLLQIILRVKIDIPESLSYVFVMPRFHTIISKRFLINILKFNFHHLGLLLQTLEALFS
jgi:hypothetical protein